MTPTNELVDVYGAMQTLKVSKHYLYRLPANVPGRFKFGRSLRFDVAMLREWAAKQAGA